MKVVLSRKEQGQAPFRERCSELREISASLAHQSKKNHCGLPALHYPAFVSVLQSKGANHLFSSRIGNGEGHFLILHSTRITNGPGITVLIASYRAGVLGRKGARHIEPALAVEDDRFGDGAVGAIEFELS